MSAEPSTTEFRSRAVWSAAAAAFGLFAYFAAQGSVRSQLHPSDPGPWSVPKTAAVLILLCSVLELLVGVLRRRAMSTAGAAEAESAADIPASMTWSDWVAMLAIAGYAPMIHVVGFSLSTLVLAPLLMRRLGATYRWWQLALIALAIVLGVRVLFGTVFQVPMPEGSLDALFRS